MDKSLFDRIIAQLLSEMDDPDARKALVESTFFGSPVLHGIDWTGSADEFTVRLVRKLHTFGTLEPGKPALIALLQTVRDKVGIDRQEKIDALTTELYGLPSEELILSDKSLSLFISYARKDGTDACERLHSQLEIQGFNVWRDKRDLNPHTGFDAEIEVAIERATHLIAILTPDVKREDSFVRLEIAYALKQGKRVIPLLFPGGHQPITIQNHTFIDFKDWNHGYSELLQRFSQSTDVKTEASLISPLEDPETDYHETLESVLVKIIRDKPEVVDAQLVDYLFTVIKEAGEDSSDKPKTERQIEIIRTKTNIASFKQEDIRRLLRVSPKSPDEYRLSRILAWAHPQYQLDKRFVHLELSTTVHDSIVSSGNERVFTDLHDAVETVEQPALILLGPPGSGKSTLLRRLQLDDALGRIRDRSNRISFYVSLNTYSDASISPREWLSKEWGKHFPDLPSFEVLAQEGSLLLLLDALNEMPHHDMRDYRSKIELWKKFLHALIAENPNNRIVFSCRTNDYSKRLSSSELPVPKVEVKPLTDEQVQQFLQIYIPSYAEEIWSNLDGSPQLEIFRTPYFLRLLIEQIGITKTIPRGKAELFTGYVRQALMREVEKDNRVFAPGLLLDDWDYDQICQAEWGDGHQLPSGGPLITKITHLAFVMQRMGMEKESSQVRLSDSEARTILGEDLYHELVTAGLDINVLDRDLVKREILFFHQLLQEYFAARKLAEEPDMSLVDIEWQIDKVQPSLAETLADMSDSDTLPPLPGTAWKETAILAAAICDDADNFVSQLMKTNLTLAALCVLSPEVEVTTQTRQSVYDTLSTRVLSYQADLRARLEAEMMLKQLS